MARWTPDPTFYASPGAAAAAPRAARLRGGAQHGHERRPRAGRARRARPRGRLADLRAARGPARHARTSATSCTTSAGTRARSALCPWAPHPHVERRYLLVPGLRSSRIHVVDVKDDPRAPEARQGRSTRRRSPARPATAARTPSTAAPTAST